MCLTVNEVVARYDVDRSTICRWKNTRDFPKAHILSEGTKRWRHQDLEEWENTLEVGFITSINWDTK